VITLKISILSIQNQETSKGSSALILNGSNWHTDEFHVAKLLAVKRPFVTVSKWPIASSQFQPKINTLPEWLAEKHFPCFSVYLIGAKPNGKKKPCRPV
jgi:hypothetical protein